MMMVVIVGVTVLTMASSVQCCVTSTYCVCTIRQSRWVAIHTAISDFLCEVALGLSFRYFTTFFLSSSSDLRLGPVVVQLLDILSYTI